MPKHMFIKDVLRVICIFIALVVAIFSLQSCDNIDLNEFLDRLTETSSSESVATIDTSSTTETTADITTASDTSQTTETTETTESIHTTETETTESSTKYPPATVPTRDTTEKTTESTTDSTLTQPDFITPEDITDEAMSERITVKYLTIHKNSRPGYKLRGIEEIVVHYVANPGSSAINNWKYFENKNGVSAHFIIDMDGSIIQCMPLDEVAWAIGTDANYTTISIECCHPDSTGKFTDETYESLVKLVSWLCNQFDLDEDDVTRHYDYERVNSSGVVWHKNCPLYYVKHPEEWAQFKKDLLIH